MVLRLTGGAAQSIFVEVPGEVAEAALAEVQRILNERLAGLTLREIRASLTDRLRDTSAPREAKELLNIFIQEGEQIFNTAPLDSPPVLLGQTSVLVEQPEFANTTSLRRLLALADRPDALGTLLSRPHTKGGLSITIGNEHEDPELSDFTLVTAQFRTGGLSGVIGVIGPTRMPYEKVITLVTHTSRLIAELID
jgi:heat-inducible transcriptional repressor